MSSKNENQGPSSIDKAMSTYADMIMEQLKQMKGSNWEKPWLFGDANAPRNFDGRNYRGINLMMLALHGENEGYEYPIYATFLKINDLNFEKKGKSRTQILDENGNALPKVSVKKGEKSFPVVYPVFKVYHRDTKQEIDYDKYVSLSKEEKEDYRVRMHRMVYRVFNIDQTNIKEARPDLYEKLTKESKLEMPVNKDSFRFQPLDDMIARQSWICPIKPTNGDHAYYSLSKNEIVVPLFEQFKDGEAFASTTFHEMAHSTGAEGFLNRIKPSAFGSEDYSREELVAELTAAIVAANYGMVKHIKKDSTAYLKSWLSNLSENPDFIKTVLPDVNKAANLIAQKIDLEIERAKGQKEREDVNTSIDIDNAVDEEEENAERRSFRR